MAATDNNKVDAYLTKHRQWAKHLTALRGILLDTELEETVKWGAPTYTLNGKNVVGLTAFKEHCALWFHQGVFLKDKDNKLINAQEGTTKGLRQWRFEQGDKINARQVRSYVLEAIENQRAGKEIKPDKKVLSLPPELIQAFRADSKLCAAFEKLTPGKQREYADHVASAKRDTTRLARVEKIAPLVLAGVGLHDKYKSC